MNVCCAECGLGVSGHTERQVYQCESCDRTYYGECVGYRTGAELYVRLHKCKKCVDTQRGLEQVVGSWRKIEGEIEGCKEGVSIMQEKVTRMQQQREEGDQESSLARTRSWAKETEALYEEGVKSGNIPDWADATVTSDGPGRAAPEGVLQPNMGSDDSVAVQEGRAGQAEIREELGEGSRGEGGVRRLDPIRFWGQGNKLSNFYSCRVEVYGQEFSSSEVAYQWRKAVFMGEARVAAEIRPMRVARESKWAASRAFGKQGWFPVTVENRARLREWDDVKIEVMRQILRAKARGCAEFVAELRGSGDHPLHEAVPKEEFWGIGQGSGKNWLGVLLMELRNTLVEVLSENNGDNGTEFSPELRGSVQPMRPRQVAETLVGDRKRAAKDSESVVEKRQRLDHQGSDRVGEEDAQMGRGIFFGSSQLRELVDKSGMGLAATTLAEKWEVKMWRGGK